MKNVFRVATPFRGFCHIAPLLGFVTVWARKDLLPSAANKKLTPPNSIFVYFFLLSLNMTFLCSFLFQESLKGARTASAKRRQKGAFLLARTTRTHPSDISETKLAILLDCRLSDFVGLSPLLCVSIVVAPYILCRLNESRL